MNPTLILLFITFLGVFTQTVSGFGMGLIIMPVLSATFGLDAARPLITLIATSTQVIVLYRTRHALTVRTVGILAAMGLLGIPAGVWLAESGWLSERALLGGLSIVIITYTLYALFAPRLPELQTDRWSGAFGLVSGVLTGAYNVGGPPVIIYADVRRWTPDTLRSNLQGFFFFKGMVLIVTHAARQNFTPAILQNYLYAVPAIALGLGLGFLMYGRVNAMRFRQIVLALLLLLGVNMLWGVVTG